MRLVITIDIHFDLASIVQIEILHQSVFAVIQFAHSFLENSLGFDVRWSHVLISLIELLLEEYHQLFHSGWFLEMSSDLFLNFDEQPMVQYELRC